MVVLGLAVFIVGLEECIFPLGTSMAQQLSDPNFLAGDSPALDSLTDGKRIGAEFYLEVILFGFLIGFSTTLAEPALIAVALKAKEISTGAISTLGLRIAVALGCRHGRGLGSVSDYRRHSAPLLHHHRLCGSHDSNLFCTQVHRSSGI